MDGWGDIVALPQQGWWESRGCAILHQVSWPIDHLPLLLALGWFVRVPVLSAEEGHEAITREAWGGLQLAPKQERALIQGVRAPDVGLAGSLLSVLPLGQRRHALRAWSGSSTADGVREVREFLSGAHARALALPDGRKRWVAFGEVLHCLQDSYSPAHVDRIGGRIVRMKHWGPLDRLRNGGRGDEHHFPSDSRDTAWQNGALTPAAREAAAASRRYLEIAFQRGLVLGERDAAVFAELLDACLGEARMP